jgi:uncharacterized protein (TIGR02145 family)
MNLNGHFFFVEDNKPVGPFTLDELLEKAISSKTFIWTKGMTNWEKIETIPIILEKLNNNQPPVFIEPKSEDLNNSRKGKGVNKTILFLFLGIIVLGLGIIGGIYFKDDLLKVLETVKVDGNQIKDIDGNIYGTTKIGKQYWTTKNLNVSRFRNGDEIPFVTSAEEWERAGELGKPACCCYGNTGYNCEKYGRLYNWFAVVDKRGLAPKGYHIPSDKEWSSLLDYLGGRANKILKSEDDWDGKNEVSFNGLPGGYRGYLGGFDNLGSVGVWGSSSEGISTGDASNLNLNANYGYVDRAFNFKEDGVSVRCLRDY